MITPLHSPASLIQRVRRNIFIRITVIAVLLSGISYYYCYSRLQDEALYNLQRYIDARSQIESSTFQQAEANTRAIRDEFLRLYPQVRNSNPAPAFDALFKQDKDGMWRIRPELDDFEHQATVAILPTTPRTPAFMRQVLLAHKLLTQFGAAYQHHSYDTFIDLHVSNASLMYLPRLNYARNGSVADFAEDIEPELLGTPERNPSRESRWTNIYFDKQALEWMVSVITPIDYQGEFIGAAGQDILLDQLISRATTINIAGTYNFIINQSGELIAHPDFAKQIHAAGGHFRMRDAGSMMLAFEQAIVKAEPGQRFVESPDGRYWLGIGRISGPNWLFITVYPKRMLQHKAMAAAGMVLILGLITLLIELMVLGWTLRKDIAQPLLRLRQAIRDLTEGRRTQELDTHRDDEIGELARSFDSMAFAIESHRQQLEDQVAERTAELARRNIELNASNQALKHLNKERNALLTIAAHDMKNPLSSISGMAELLRSRLDNWPTEKIADRLNGIGQLATRIQEIIGNLLDSDALESGQMPMHIGKIAIDSTITEVLRPLADRLQEKQQTCHYRASELYAQADQQALLRVIENLVSNAIKFSPLHAQISIESQRKGECIEIVVRDNGPGIAPHEVPLLFKKFSRLSSQPTGGEQSTGLGLSIVKQLVEAMHGRIYHESQLGHGASFFVVLPAAQ